MNGAKVYSYTRFSDPKQALGHSADRQLQYAKVWAAERGLTLDESLSLKDEGLSAFHQRHVKQGALGVFLLAVDEGRIPPGSVLIVEGLDRLSRAEPIQAQAQLAQIINAGITVVTASDGREYNREKLKAQPMDLVYSLLVMIRAHEESDTKSKRVKAAIRRQCEGWMAGTYRGLIRNGGDANWLKWTGSAWELIPDRVEVVLLAIEKYKEGLGSDRAYRFMIERGYNLNTVGINAAQLYRLIKLPALKGVKRLAIDGEDFELPDYYPRLMSDIEFDELQLLTTQRSRRRPKGAIPGVVTGIGISYCGYCGAGMTGVNQMAKIQADGMLRDCNRRLICLSNLNAKGCSHGSISVAPVERALMAYCSDHMNLQRLLEPAHDGQDLRVHLMNARKVVDDLDRQLSRVTEALLAGESDGATPMVFVRKARELEEQLQAAKVAVQQAERELVSATSRQAPADARVWANLVAGVDAQEVGPREMVRQLMMDTFERIVLYIRGVVPDGRKYIDVLLIAKSGQRRWMRIERRTGQWAAGSDRP
ncbi:recombinase family protein [Pseudomonas gingeri]|uniref:recombinase family protein n=1 Tax=Pseudomonas gingeri TaxID=117681 RepID=UPI0015A42E88|nr:recombinase family protein [Pseudomonas gingeri]NWA25798.1 recombinase family protein [Pseudomonas gingeri]